MKILTNNDFALKNLKKDFRLYITKDNKRNLFKCININIFREKPPYYKIPPLEASLYNRGSICYRNKAMHYVDYAGKGLMIYNFKKENADIYSEDETLLYEKARLAILSRIGELLDKRHIHRIHAVGFSKDKKATICLLPMEAGKTTMAVNVLRDNNGIKLISDDICFIDFKQYVYPFMLRVGIRDKDFISNIPDEYITKINRDFYGEKYLIDLIYFKDHIAKKSKVYNILIGKRIFQEKTEIKRISKTRCIIPFIQSGVFGLGLPQIVELFLRCNFLDIFNKIIFLFSRAFLFLILIFRAKTYEFRIGRNQVNAAKELANFVIMN